MNSEEVFLQGFALHFLLYDSVMIARGESEYWIELLLESGYYNDKSLLDQCTEVKRILISSINTVKAKQENGKKEQ